jgi:parallel beta-helix repeat protein
MKWAAALLALAGVLATESQAATLTVTSTGDLGLNDGTCELGKAIFAIDSGADNNCVHTGTAYGTNDTVAFNIPMNDPGCNARTGVCRITITRATSLIIGKPMVIDGYTQPGASANTLIGGVYPSAKGLNTRIKIEVTSKSTLEGFLVGAPMASEIRGLAIFGFTTACIELVSANNLIDGNFIGLTAGGQPTASGDCGYGIFAGIESASNNIIGGFTPASRNLISRAAISGIGLWSPNNVVAGNLIGTNPAGTVGYGLATASGIAVASVSGNSVVNNVIADWGTAGIWLAGADGTTINGNAIGIGVGGVALGNGLSMPNGAGIWLQSPRFATGTNNQIFNNGIAWNGGDGILVVGSAAGDPTGNRLDRNSIFSNGGLGINLQPVGEANRTVTANDAVPGGALDADPDTGPNGLQNFPVITAVTLNGTGGVDIAYTLDSAPYRHYAISAYASDTCNYAGYGEGRYLADVPLSWSTDGAGHLAQSFSYGSMPAGWAVGMWVTLLARNATTGDTSEFSRCVQIPAPTMPRAPTLSRLVSGNHLIRVLFAPPTSDGGSPISSYTAACRNGAATYSATDLTSPITVVGLDNGMTYTCSVHASNVFGAGAESLASSQMVRPQSLLPVLTAILGD